MIELESVGAWLGNNSAPCHLKSGGGSWMCDDSGGSSSRVGGRWITSWRQESQEKAKCMSGQRDVSLYFLRVT